MGRKIEKSRISGEGGTSMRKVGLLLMAAGFIAIAGTLGAYMADTYTILETLIRVVIAMLIAERGAVMARCIV